MNLRWFGGGVYGRRPASQVGFDPVLGWEVAMRGDAAIRGRMAREESSDGGRINAIMGQPVGGGGKESADLDNVQLG
jgi:hypothetical protein